MGVVECEKSSSFIVLLSLQFFFFLACRLWVIQGAVNKVTRDYKNDMNFIWEELSNLYMCKKNLLIHTYIWVSFFIILNHLVSQNVNSLASFNIGGFSCAEVLLCHAVTDVSKSLWESEKRPQARPAAPVLPILVDVSYDGWDQAHIKVACVIYISTSPTEIK